MLDFATKNHQLIGLFLLTFIICRTPVIGLYFRCLNTLIHETGHALCSIFTNGSVERIEIFNNTSGAIYTGAKNAAGKFLVPLAGYPSASAFSYGAFRLLEHGRQTWFLFILGGISLLALLLWVRNRYGIFWLLTFSSLLGGVWYLHHPSLTFYFCNFLACILVVESLYSALVIAGLAVFSPKKAVDAYNLRKLTYIPTLIWGLFFLLTALYFSAMTLDLLFNINAIAWIEGILQGMDVKRPF